MRSSTITRRFVIFSLLLALALCLCVVLSIEYFGRSSWERQPSVALILASAKDAPGWPREIAWGLQEACDITGYNLYIEENVSITDNNLQKVTERLAKKGVRDIFLANPGYQQNLEAMAIKYPQVSFHANSVGEVPSQRMLSYSVRYYEARYLAGLLAGLHSKSGIVGYVGPFPATDTRRDLNAFALGAQRARPDIRVLAAWTGQWIAPDKENKALYRLKAENADVITYFLASQNLAREAQALEMDYIDFHHPGVHWPSHCLAAMETNWARVYADLLRLNLRGQSGLTYWRGMAEGVLSLRLGQKIPPAEETMVLRARNEILKGQPIFSGQIEDIEGRLRCREGEVMANNSLLSDMNWLVKGVEVIDAR